MPFLYGVYVKDTSFMLIMQYCSLDGKLVTLSDAADSKELSLLLVTHSFQAN